MYDYETELRLRSTEQGGRRSPIRTGYRSLVRLADGLHDIDIDLLAQDELQPGNCSLAGVSFLRPDLVHSLVKMDEEYALFEGPKEIGTVNVRSDV